MAILIALILGVLGYFISKLVFNDPISFLIGAAIAVFYFVGDGRGFWRR